MADLNKYHNKAAIFFKKKCLMILNLVENNILSHYTMAEQWVNICVQVHGNNCSVL